MFKKMKEIPRFYNSLEETKKEIFSLLFQGVNKRKSNFHNTVLNTIGIDKKPKSRTVVLRNFSEEDLTINIHSDLRANKINELNENNNTSLLFYDHQKKIQLRVEGTAKIEKSNKTSWEKLSNWSRRCYLSIEKPGTISESPSSGFPSKFSDEAPSDKESEEGIKNFSVIKIFIFKIEWLYLASQGHRRALFEVNRSLSKIKVKSRWLIP